MPPRCEIAALIFKNETRPSDLPLATRRSCFAIPRPVFTLAGIWTEYRGDRGTKSRPIPGPHLIYASPTIAPNAVVVPIHPKAIPVILTTDA